MWKVCSSFTEFSNESVTNFMETKTNSQFFFLIANLIWNQWFFSILANHNCCRRMRKENKIIQNIIIVLIILCHSHSLPFFGDNPCNLWSILNGQTIFSGGYYKYQAFFQCVQWPIKPTKCNYKAIIKKCVRQGVLFLRSVLRSTRENRTLMPGTTLIDFIKVLIKTLHVACICV